MSTLSDSMQAGNAGREPSSSRAVDHRLTVPVTLRTLTRMMRQKEPIACLTCYDATTARWLERAGIPVLLVGDSAAQVILGFDQPIHAPLDFMLHITAAVKRGAPNCFVMGDMPFMSYQADDAEAIRNAGRFLTEGLADAVKLEVDETYAELVHKLDRAGIPVVAHIGWRPQRARHDGVRTALVAGRTQAEVDRLVLQAVRLAEAGAVMLLVEQTTAEVSQRIVEKVSIPVIGCGGGPACHGHIVVLQDLLGLTAWQPSFAQPVTSLGEALCAAAVRWKEKVQNRDMGEHPYRMSD
ncbi:MAG TPA: 3-methyl-2-oxobutanoate hydroxymethyltransferase [Phycisphaerales bacterium]|nr:3-methyl-2-oxobutanoate hydroxymethyltransferase [Phycisphaerales bacterium]